MQNPCLRINSKKFLANAQALGAAFEKYDKKVHFVTKCVCAYEPLVKLLAENGFTHLADSRLENFEVLKKYAEDSLLLRLPMLSELSKVVSLCDISLNSELATIKGLSEAALVQQKLHKIILMLELGDRREGADLEEAEEIIRAMQQLKGVKLVGLGANFNCYGGVIPDQGKMQVLGDFAQTMEEKYGVELEYVSGGNSGSLYLLQEGKLPASVNHLRIGEALLLGRETSYGQDLPGMYQDAFSLRAEVIEAKRKHSLPDGKIGLNALGQPVSFEDRGYLDRVILAIGAQDVEPSELRPLQAGVEFLGNSSDHSIYNISDYEGELSVGDSLEFGLDYACLLRLSTSPYVHKELY
ncbi:MAG: alanine/ornithine racemase family PLP-dependent enzyme [Eubacteriales bacterium]|nr:alanine/ornithine racemase family PLP-dependent enzyme [Eubacteriales bacterium]